MSASPTRVARERAISESHCHGQSHPLNCVVNEILATDSFIPFDLLDVASHPHQPNS